MTRTGFQAAALLALLGSLCATGCARGGDADALHARIDQLADQYEPEMIANRRYLHQHPELSNREFETEKYLVSHLKAMGYEVQSGIAHTGVVAYCAAASPGRLSRCAPTWTRCR